LQTEEVVGSSSGSRVAVLSLAQVLEVVKKIRGKMASHVVVFRAVSAAVEEVRMLVQHGLLRLGLGLRRQRIWL